MTSDLDALSLTQVMGQALRVKATDQVSPSQVRGQESQIMGQKSVVMVIIRGHAQGSLMVICQGSLVRVTGQGQVTGQRSRVTGQWSRVTGQR